MKILKCFVFFLLMSFMTYSVYQCRGQSSGLSITSQPYQWNSDNNYLQATTDNWLTLEIIIWNNSTIPLQSSVSIYPPNNLWILVLVTNTVNPTSYVFRQEIDINSLYLPPNETDTRFVNINNLQIGSYSAVLTWGWSQYSSSQGNPIEPYPFDFKIVSEQEFQQMIKQNPSHTTYNIKFYLPPITLFSGGGITLIALAIGIRKANKKEDKKQK